MQVVEEHLPRGEHLAHAVLQLAREHDLADHLICVRLRLRLRARVRVRVRVRFG